MVRWLMGYLTRSQDDIVKGQGMDVVFSHNDVIELGQGW